MTLETVVGVKSSNCLLGFIMFQVRKERKEGATEGKRKG